MAVKLLEDTSDPFKVLIACRAISKSLPQMLREQPNSDPYFHMRKEGQLTQIKTSVVRTVDALKTLIREQNNMTVKAFNILLRILKQTYKMQENYETEFHTYLKDKVSEALDFDPEVE